MIKAKRVVEIVRKWPKMAARGRRRISYDVVEDSCTSGKVAAIADKGHFVAYAADGKRFMVPLAYLHRPVFLELLNMAEEEFGFSIDGALTFPCDAVRIDCAVSLVPENAIREVEDALLVSLSSSSSTNGGTACLSGAVSARHLVLGRCKF